MIPPDELLLLFACEACADNDCMNCVHRTVGAWCPHSCWWLWRLRLVRTEGDE